MKGVDILENTVEIKSGNYNAIINLSRGANCISLTNTKYNAVILREPDYSKKLDNPFIYGMPVLFPVNRISGGEFTFEGRKYVFPVNEPATGCHLHGELHKTEFKVVKHRKNILVCSYVADEKNPYLSFPHNFEIKIIYKLNKSGLTHIIKIKNMSNINMPCFIGFHTAFNTLFTKNNTVKNTCIYAEIKEEFERNMSNFLPTGKKICFDAVSNALANGSLKPDIKTISRHYKAGGKGKMLIYDKGTNLSLVYKNDKKYKFRLIYSSNCDEYICLEPQNCMANCANSPFNKAESGFDYIKPGKTKVYKSKIYIKEGYAL